MILILFFTFLNSLKANETDAMKAMDKKLFKAQLEKHLEKKSIEKEPKAEIKKDIAKDNKVKEESLSSKEKIKKIAKVKFIHNCINYNKLLNEIKNNYKIKITYKGNLLIGSKIENLDLLNKLYGSSKYFYFPLKKASYNFSKNYDFYSFKNLTIFLDMFAKDGSKIEESKGEIFDIFVEEFQEEIY